LKKKSETTIKFEGKEAAVQVGLFGMQDHVKEESKRSRPGSEVKLEKCKGKIDRA
jgi:hypothetical protein